MRQTTRALSFLAAFSLLASYSPTARAQEGDAEADTGQGAVVELSEGHLQVQRWYLRAAFGWLDGEGERPSARIVPNYEDGAPAGLRLTAIRPGSVLAGLGFRNGDRIVSVDGAPASPETLAELGDATADSYTLTVERRGRERTLRIDVEDTQPEPEDVASTIPARPPSANAHVRERLQSWLSENGVEARPLTRPQRVRRGGLTRSYWAEVPLGGVADLDEAPPLLAPLRGLPDWARLVEVRAAPPLNREHRDTIGVVAVIVLAEPPAGDGEGTGQSESEGPLLPQSASSPLDALTRLLAERDGLVAEWLPELRMTSFQLGERSSVGGWVPDLDGLAVIIWWADRLTCPAGPITLEYDAAPGGGYEFEVSWDDGCLHSVEAEH